jgi:acyl-CoA dehydrogenase
MTATDSPGGSAGTGQTVFDVDELLTDSADNLFAATCTFDTVQAAETEGWAPTVWSAVAEAGFAWIGLPAEAGGSGGTLLDAAEVLRIAGAHAAPIPLAETAMLGGWLLAEAGLELPDGPISVVPGVDGDTLTARAGDDGSIVLDGRAGRVPWASRADRIAALVTVDGRELAVAIDPDSVTIEPAANLAGEPRPTVVCDRLTVPAERVGELRAGTDRTGGTGGAAEELRLRGALSRVVLMAGALDAMSRLTVAYTQERQQFGRPIARFQAVQQHLVWGAQDAALVAMAARVAAARASARGVVATRFEIASARTVADECAGTATRWSHQAHGAMGMTQEYALHHLSRRLWSWRREWAVPGRWPATVGGLAEAAGPDGLYPLIASQ